MRFPVGTRTGPPCVDVVIFLSPSLVGTGWGSVGSVKKCAVQLNIWRESPESITSRRVERFGDNADSDNRATDLRLVCALKFPGQNNDASSS